jgi:hypothetical protein
MCNWSNYYANYFCPRQLVGFNPFVFGSQNAWHPLGCHIGWAPYFNMADARSFLIFKVRLLQNGYLLALFNYNLLFKYGGYFLIIT